MERKIIDTHHSIERYAKRYSKIISKERVQKAIYDAMDIIFSQYKDTTGTYAIYSMSTGICAIIDWRRDNQNFRDKNNHAIVVTLPPLKRSHKDFKTTSPKDIKLIVESILQKTVRLKEDCSNYIQEVKIGSIRMFFEDGKLYDSGIEYFIGVE